MTCRYINTVYSNAEIKALDVVGSKDLTAIKQTRRELNELYQGVLNIEQRIFYSIHHNNTMAALDGSIKDIKGAEDSGQ